MGAQRSTAPRYRTALRSLLRPRTERERNRRRLVLCCLPFFSLALVGGLYPLWMLFRMSLSTSNFYVTFDPVQAAVRSLAAGRLVAPGTSLTAYREVLGIDRLLAGDLTLFHRAAINTVWFATATTAVSLGAAVPVAHALEKYDLPGEDRLLTLLSFPISLPGIVAAFMIIVLFGNTGVGTGVAVALTHSVPLIDPRTATQVAFAKELLGLFIAYCYSMIPRSLLLLRGAYAEVNVPAEEAARSLGATPIRTFLHVTLPEIWPGLVGAALLTFRTALAIFGTLLILRGALVPQPWTYQIEQVLTPEWQMRVAAVMGLVWFGVVFLFTVVVLRYTSAEVSI